MRAQLHFGAPVLWHVQKKMKNILALKWWGGLCEFGIIITFWIGFICFALNVFDLQRFDRLEQKWLGLGFAVIYGVGSTVYYYKVVSRRYKETIPLEEFRMAHICFHMFLIAFCFGLLSLNAFEADYFVVMFIGPLYFVLGCSAALAFNCVWCDSVPSD